MRRMKCLGRPGVGGRRRDLSSWRTHTGQYILVRYDRQAATSTASTASAAASSSDCGSCGSGGSTQCLVSTSMIGAKAGIHEIANRFRGKLAYEVLHFVVHCGA